MRAWRFLFPLAFSLAFVLAAPVEAGRNQDKARDAVRAGEILPLDAVLAAVGRQVDGRVVDVDLREQGNAYTYRVKVLTPEGRLVIVTVDAVTAAVIGVRGE